MQWFKNCKTVTKLMFAFSLMAVLMGVVGYEGVSAANSINEMNTLLYTRDMVGLSAIKQAGIILTRIERDSQSAILSHDASEIESIAASVEGYIPQLQEQLRTTENTLVRDDTRTEMTRVKQRLPEYEAQIRDALALAKLDTNESNAKAFEKLKRTRFIADEINKMVDDISQKKETIGKQTDEDCNVRYSKARTTILGCLIVAVFLCLGLGYFIAQLIAKPLNATVNTLARVADFDLTASLDVHTQDEVGKMATALNETIQALREALLNIRNSLERMANGDLTASVDIAGTKGEVRVMAEALNRTIEQMRQALSEVGQSAEAMADSAQQLAAASEELSSGTQEQASSLEETTATLEQITSTVKQNAESAKQAAQVANGSRDAAEKGSEVVCDAVSAMGEINEASKNIAEIISTIDEIAFQTNLLALNAAVEAARAGEQGRGFAVVATEVRNLAQRSASSAKEIKRLIQDSVSKVENGSVLVTKSGDTLQGIIDSVKKVNDIVAEIASASREQSTGVEQVNKAMLQMDQVTQTNSSQTEELSSTAQSLASHAEQLQALLRRFKVDKGERQALPISPVKATSVPARTKAMSATAAASGMAAKTHTASASVTKVKPNGHDTDASTFIEF